jgi:hypothetical protein
MTDEPAVVQEIEDDEYEVRVTLTIAIRRRSPSKYPGLRREAEDVYGAFCRGAKKQLKAKEYPPGTVRLRSWESRVLDAKALRRAQRQRLKKQSALAAVATQSSIPSETP